MINYRTKVKFFKIVVNTLLLFNANINSFPIKIIFSSLVHCSELEVTININIFPMLAMGGGGDYQCALFKMSMMAFNECTAALLLTAMLHYHNIDDEQ